MVLGNGSNLHPDRSCTSICMNFFLNIFINIFILNKKKGTVRFNTLRKTNVGLKKKYIKD